MKSIILANEFLAETRPRRLTALENLCGISLLERHVRNLKKSGVSSISIVIPAESDIAPMLMDKLKKLSALVEVVRQDAAARALRGEKELLIIAADYYIERQFIDYLAQASKPCLLLDREAHKVSQISANSPHGSVGCARIDGSTLCSLFAEGVYSWAGIVDALAEDDAIKHCDVGTLPTYNHAVRRHRQSKWISIGNGTALTKARSWIIEGAQKGSLDLPAKVLHAPIENFIVSRLCEGSITPNQLTLVTNIAAWLVTWGILSGFLWTSLIGAALVGIMDGLDGKLARVKVMTSKVGELEHLFDMIFEYSWWLCLGWVLGGASLSSAAFMAGIGLVIVSFADTLIGVIFWVVHGCWHNRTIDNYTPFELTVRKFGGRRNIYIWLMLITGPLIGLEAALWVCVWWGVVTIFIRGGRALWLGGTRRTPMEFAF